MAATVNVAVPEKVNVVNKQLLTLGTREAAGMEADFRTHSVGDHSKPARIYGQLTPVTSRKAVFRDWPYISNADSFIFTFLGKFLEFLHFLVSKTIAELGVKVVQRKLTL